MMVQVVPFFQSHRTNARDTGEEKPTDQTCCFPDQRSHRTPLQTTDQSFRYFALTYVNNFDYRHRRGKIRGLILIKNVFRE